MVHKKIAKWMFFCAVSTPSAMSCFSATAATNINIIQYNVKAQGPTLGVWDTPIYQAKQIELINRKVDESGSNVDFITLEQADQVSGVPGPFLNNKMTTPNKWGNITSICAPDTTQLVYDKTKWKPILSLATDTYQPCWASGRPYNMAYFSSLTSNFNVLVIVSHLPHPGIPLNSEQFKSDLAKMIDGKITPHVIFAGDFNDVENTADQISKDLFEKNTYGEFTFSNPLMTCCRNNNFSNKFDLAAVSSFSTQPAVSAKIIEYPDLAAPFHDTSASEEHKPIFVQITIPD